MKMREVGSGTHSKRVSLYLTNVLQIEDSTAICPVGRGKAGGEKEAL